VAASIARPAAARPRIKSRLFRVRLLPDNARLCPAVLDWLTGHGAAPHAAEGVDGLIAAILADDGATVGRLRRHAARRAWYAIPLLAELGST
jgi:hypothetical protein